MQAMDEYESIVSELERQSLLRQLETSDEAHGCILTRGGRHFVNFASNDYLGLSQHPAIVQSAKAAIDRFGVGAGASRLVTGSLAPHRALEETLAGYKGTEAALVFSSGFATALGVITALVGRGDIVVLDKLAHACLVDAAKLSGALLRIYPHNNLDRLAALLEWAERKQPRARVLVVTESVFSMDGDIPDLAEIVRLKSRVGARLLLDEAHATGVVGPGGRGLSAATGLTDAVDVHLGTLSKALGVSGGFVVGRRSLIQVLINRARSFIFSTAPPPAVAAAALTSLQLLQSDTGDQLRRKLQTNTEQLFRRLPEASRPRRPQHIVPIILGSDERALEAARRLKDAGFLAPAIRYPTVGRGSARLRLTMTADHTSEQIEELTALIQRKV